MKYKLNRFVLFVVLIFFAAGCSKEKKPEFVDDQSIDKKEEVKQDIKQEVKQETDSGKLKAEDLSGDNFRKKMVESDKVVAVISPLEAGEYHGKLVTVKGFVADIYQSDKVAYLNFVEKYPNNPFTGVIFASKFADFPNIDKYKNKNVEITGRVSKFKDKPQIILNDPKQIIIK
jgi:hypothetical protein